MIVRTNYEGQALMLVLEDGTPVEVGNTFALRDGEDCVLEDARAPHKAGSTGRVYVAAGDGRFSREFFPSVIGCMWKPVDETAHGGQFGERSE